MAKILNVSLNVVESVMNPEKKYVQMINAVTKNAEKIRLEVSLFFISVPSVISFTHGDKTQPIFFFQLLYNFQIIGQCRKQVIKA